MSLDKHEDATYYHVYFAHLGAYNHPGRSEEHQPGGVLCHMQPYGYPFAVAHTAVLFLPEHLRSQPDHAG